MIDAVAIARAQGRRDVLDVVRRVMNTAEADYIEARVKAALAGVDFEKAASTTPAKDVSTHGRSAEAIPPRPASGMAQSAALLPSAEAALNSRESGATWRDGVTGRGA